MVVTLVGPKGVGVLLLPGLPHHDQVLLKEITERRHDECSRHPTKGDGIKLGGSSEEEVVGLLKNGLTPIEGNRALEVVVRHLEAPQRKEGLVLIKIFVAVIVVIVVVVEGVTDVVAVVVVGVIVIA